MWRSTKPGTASPPPAAGSAPTSSTRPSCTTTSPGTTVPSTSAARTPSRYGPWETDGGPLMWSRPLYRDFCVPPIALAPGLLGDGEGLDAHVLGGLVARVGGLALDGVHDVHAVDDAAEDR